MAITNAQQYQQLVNKPANGKRPGYRGVGGYRGGPGGSGGKGGREAPGSGRTEESRGFDTGPNVGRDPNEKPPQQIIGGQSYNVTPDTKTIRNIAENIEKVERDLRKKDFINTKRKPVNTPFPLVNTAFNFLGNVLPNNRKFFAENVANNKYGYELTEEDYEEYDRARKAGEINAFGRPLTQAERDSFFGRDDGPDQPIIPIIPEPVDPGEGEDDNIVTNPLAYRFMADGGRAEFQEGGIMPRLNQLSGNVSSAEQMLQEINQRLESAESSLGSGGSIGSLVGPNVGNEIAVPSISGTPTFTPLPEDKGGSFGSGGSLDQGMGPNQLAEAKLENILPGMRPGNIPGTNAPYSSLRGSLNQFSSGVDTLNVTPPQTPVAMQSPLQQTVGMANGGRIGFAYGDTAEDNAMQASGIMGLPMNENPAGVKELDLRETGGFIPPVGVKEKADDIPAMLSNN